MQFLRRETINEKNRIVSILWQKYVDSHVIRLHETILLPDDERIWFISSFLKTCPKPATCYKQHRDTILNTQARFYDADRYR